MYTVTEFTPWSALLGGMLIGLSAVLMLGFNGRITGISGIVGHLPSSRGHELAWRLVFTLGLLGGVVCYAALSSDGLSLNVDASLPKMLLAGLIVGGGTRLGRGCTSGHGVCGIGRLSSRSIAATAVFMGVAGMTVFVSRHVVGV
jgi:uncharacterized membrane protein YedE/YeeE